MSIHGADLYTFKSLPLPKGQKGVSHIAYMSKVANGKQEFSDFFEVNGLCKYRFIYCLDMIVGLLFVTPCTQTKVSPSHIAIGSTSEKFTCNYNLQPQGVILFESAECSTLVMSLKVSSPLLIQVDL